MHLFDAFELDSGREPQTCRLASRSLREPAPSRDRGVETPSRSFERPSCDASHLAFTFSALPTDQQEFGVSAPRTAVTSFEEIINARPRGTAGVQLRPAGHSCHTCASEP